MKLGNIKNILVTGGAGYVGSTAVKELLENGYNVTVLDNLSFGDEGLNAIKGHAGFSFIRGDVTVYDDVTEAFRNNSFEAVIHLAAIVGDPACAKQPELATKINWDASVNLLDRSIENNVKRFVFASTCSNYGKMKNPDGFVNENSPLAPVSLYAELKVRFENYILNEIEKKDGFCPIALRFATVYGPSPRMRFDLTVNEFTKELALGRELEVFGEQFWRPYCHVGDFAKAIILAIESGKEKVAYKVFNVGDTSENYQKQMIVEEINKIIPSAKVKYVKKNEDPRDYKVSFEKIKDELGFKISKRVPDGIKEIKDLIESNAYTDPDDVKYRNS